MTIQEAEQREIELRKWCLETSIRREKFKPEHAQKENVYESARSMFEFVTGKMQSVETQPIEKTPTKENCPQTFDSINPYTDVIGEESKEGVLSKLKQDRFENLDESEALDFMGKLDALGNRRHKVVVNPMEFRTLAEVAEYFNNYNNR